MAPREVGGKLPGKSRHQRAGRPSSEITTRCQAIIERSKLLDVLEDIALKGAKDADRLSALKLLLAYGYGQPAQPIEVGAGDGTDVTFTLRTSPA